MSLDADKRKVLIVALTFRETRQIRWLDDLMVERVQVQRGECQPVMVQHYCAAIITC